MEILVRKTIDQYDLISEFDKIVIGVSGGHDSMALLYVLDSLKEKYKFEISVAHINHGVRGLEAYRDELYVKEISEHLGFSFYSHRANMDNYAKENKLTSEEAGREIRYQFFREVVKLEKADKIAVAHNRDDQAETLIMRFMRGTGIDGLRGMEFKTGNIIRPILDVRRVDIEKYCQDKNIEPRIDKTNAMPIYGRNKVRLELIPYIEETFNSGIINTLSRTSETMKVDSDFLRQYTERKYKQTLKSFDQSKVVLDIGVMMKLHLAIKMRVVRYAIEQLNTNLKGIERKHIEDILNLVSRNETGKKINIANDIVARISYNELVLEKNKQTTKLSFNHKIDINSTVEIQEIGGKIKASIHSIKDVDIDFNNKLVKCFDYDNIKSEIYLRNRKKGDRFNPLGMSGSKKIKDFFIDEKIPKDKRDTIPIVVDGENIIWVVGFRISENYKVEASTKNVLILEYKE